MTSPKKSRAPSAPPLPSGFPATATTGASGTGSAPAYALTLPPGTAVTTGTSAPGADGSAAHETHVAARLGIAREKISLIRGTQLQEVVDFVWLGNAVVYTEGGLARLAAIVAKTHPATLPLAGSPMPATATGQPALTLAACSPERALVQVVRTLPNGKMMFVRRADPRTDAAHAPTFIVRVKDNRHFHPKLTPFEVRRASDGQWLYLGRLPRSLGRW